MIEKSQLIDRLREAVKMEENLISIYSNHMRSVLAYSSLDRKVQAEITSILQKLAGDSFGHEDLLLDLVDSLSNGTENVY